MVYAKKNSLKINKLQKSLKSSQRIAKILLAAIFGCAVFLPVTCEVAMGSIGLKSGNSNSGKAGNGYAVGTLPGKFKVSQTGAANYSIDIATPPGTAGITPQLTISYNSQQDNGLLGMGFSLQGLTGITRCSSNIAQNGVTHGVDYTDQDRFCFNGDQLVAVKGAYGADGTEYRTYINSNTKIISYGRQGNGPAQFKIWTKGGQVAEYGFTSDSQVYAQGKDTVAIWALDKIIDTAGNYLQVKYSKDDANGMYYPAEIDYTGNDAAKLKPYNSVKFSYEGRPDAKDMYTAGSKVRANLRLNGIQTYSGTQIVYNYKLVYEQSPDTGRSRITSIQECAGDGVCLAPTTFGWKSGGSRGWQNTPDFNPPDAIVYEADDGSRTDAGMRLVDLNGDGIEDLIKYDTALKSIWKGAWINTGSGWMQANNFIPPEAIVYEIEGGYRTDAGMRLIDLNGDGIEDLIKYDAANGHVAWKGAWINTGNGWAQENNFMPPDAIVYEIDDGSRTDAGMRLIDLNGDGLLDLVKYDSGLKSIWKGAWINTGSGWMQANNFIPPEAIVYEIEGGSRTDAGMRLIDLNGDGIEDLIKYDSALKSIWKGAWINTGNGWLQADNFIPPDAIVYEADDGSRTDAGMRLIDLNGDGLLDLIKYDTALKSIWKGAWINTGSGWLQADNFIPPEAIVYEVDGGSRTDAGMRLIDLNGDGLLDLIKYDAANGHVDWKGAWINTGNGWAQENNFMPPDAIVYEIDDGSRTDAGMRLIDLNGDGLLDLVKYDSALKGTWKGAWLNTAQKPDLLASVTDGYNAHIYLTYQPITNKAIYTKESGAQFPINDIQSPIYVVTQTQSEHVSNYVATSNATAGLHITNYTYQGAKVHKQGFGFLGFRQITTKDASTGINVTTTYTQDVANHNIGQTQATETRLANGTLISSTQNTWETRAYGSGALNGTYYLYYTKQVLTKGYTLQGSFISSKTHDIQVDDYTNPILSTVTAQDNTGSYITTTKSTYTNNTAKWLIGQVDKTTVTAQAPNTSDITRTSSFTYDPNNGMLKQSISEPGDPQYQITTTYDRDVYGNVIKTTVSAANVADRVTTQTYDPTGRFVLQTVNPLGHTGSTIYDQRFGQPTQATDPNKLTTTYQYDSFGRPILTTYPDQTQETLTYNWTNYGGAIYSITTQKTDSPTQVSYYDCLGREIAASTQGFDGRLIWHTTQYDDLGRVVQQTLPHFAEDTAPTVGMEYDVLGRLIKTINPNKTTTTITYNGLTTTSTNAKGQTQTKIYNARNDLLETIDNHGNHTHYYYDAFSNMIKLVDSAGNTSTISYDKYGRKTDVNDPDKGHWTYTYDPLGQLTSQTDALQKTTKFTYDKLGRLITRQDPAGTSGWIYDTAAFGIGKLYQVSGLAGLQGQAPNAVQIIKALSDGLVNYTKNYKYDTLGRPQQITSNINGQMYFQRYTYDKDSRIDTINYPGNVTVKYNYNDLSFMTKITDVSGKKTYWQLNNMDAAGHVTSETHSNGLITNYTYDPLTSNLIDLKTTLNKALKIQKQLFPQATAVNQVTQNKPKEEKTKNTASPIPNSQGFSDIIPYQQLHYTYDNIGNILTREDPTYNTTEAFTYDDLNRLTQNDLTVGHRPTTTTYKYDDLGNITYKSDVGTYTYGERGAGPHAVTSVKGIKDASFAYNQNGDQVTANINGKSRGILYTSYSKPLKIISPTATIAFYYNADRDSFERVDQQGPASTTTYYMGDYELISYTDGFNKNYTEQKYYIGPNTIYVVHQDGPTKAITTHLYETLKDNLGSLTDITDENANLIQHFYYTPFGDQSQTKGTKPDSPITHHGFTGHEQVELVGLIHMKGRIYDPVFGRFLTADPEVQDPENSQALNRYSYCVNNPLRYTDPTGYNFFGDIVHGIGQAFGAIGKLLLQNKEMNELMMIGLGALAPTNPWLYALIPVMSGATTAANGGNFADVIKATAITAVEEAAFYKAGNIKNADLAAAKALGEDTVSAQIKSAALHGVIGGGINVMQGRNFQDGFLSAAVVDSMSGAIDQIGGGSKDFFPIMQRATASGIVGGTVAAATGGNFWDGFETGAASRLFNDEAAGHQESKIEALCTKLDEYAGVLNDVGNALMPFDGVGMIPKLGAEGVKGLAAGVRVAEEGVELAVKGAKVAENAIAKFYGREYTSHALAQMETRNIPPSAIEGTIKNGISNLDPIQGRMQYHTPGGGRSGQPGLTVITDTVSGRVITAIKRSSNWGGP